jgi:ferredoxin
MSGPKKAATLVLNPILCDGRGMCHEAAPDLVGLDEWGYPLLPGGGLRSELTRADLKAAEDATHACPLLALHIER